MAGVEFLGFLGITSFWILFLNQNGMSLLQIGLSLGLLLAQWSAFGHGCL